MLSITLANSPIESITFRNRQFFIKRDDLLHHSFSGNKARKFHYFLNNKASNINRLISYGSVQANSLFSFSALAKLKNWQLDYYVHHIPSYLKENPRGNYRAALENNANIVEVCNQLANRDIKTYLQEEILLNDTNALFVPEGGRCQEASYGINILANEIIDWTKDKKIQNIMIALPSGTGTTALFLQQRFVQLKLPFKVLTCACVGGSNYLKKQFFELSSNENNHPTIIDAGRKYHFGKLYSEFYSVWQELLAETGIEFELLYDPLGWISLLNHLTQIPNNTLPIIYIHQGGLLGNETMQPRYERKFQQVHRGI